MTRLEPLPDGCYHVHTASGQSVVATHVLLATNCSTNFPALLGAGDGQGPPLAAAPLQLTNCTETVLLCEVSEDALTQLPCVVYVGEDERDSCYIVVRPCCNLPV